MDQLSPAANLGNGFYEYVVAVMMRYNFLSSRITQRGSFQRCFGVFAMLLRWLMATLLVAAVICLCRSGRIDDRLDFQFGDAGHVNSSFRILSDHGVVRFVSSSYEVALTRWAYPPAWVAMPISPAGVMTPMAARPLNQDCWYPQKYRWGMEFGSRPSLESLIKLHEMWLRFDLSKCVSDTMFRQSCELGTQSYFAIEYRALVIILAVILVLLIMLSSFRNIVRDKWGPGFPVLSEEEAKKATSTGGREKEQRKKKSLLNMPLSTLKGTGPFIR